MFWKYVRKNRLFNNTHSINSLSANQNRNTVHLKNSFDSKITLKNDNIKEPLNASQIDFSDLEFKTTQFVAKRRNKLKNRFEKLPCINNQNTAQNALANLSKTLDSRNKPDDKYDMAEIEKILEELGEPSKPKLHVKSRRKQSKGCKNDSCTYTKSRLESLTTEENSHSSGDENEYIECIAKKIRFSCHKIQI